jgi:cobalamin biosynthesis protein CobT
MAILNINQPVHSMFKAIYDYCKDNQLNSDSHLNYLRRSIRDRQISGRDIIASFFVKQDEISKFIQFWSNTIGKFEEDDDSDDPDYEVEDEDEDDDSDDPDYEVEDEDEDDDSDYEEEDEDEDDDSEDPGHEEVAENENDILDKPLYTLFKMIATYCNRYGVIHSNFLNLLRKLINLKVVSGSSSIRAFVDKQEEICQNYGPGLVQIVRTVCGLPNVSLPAPIVRVIKYF